jgi:hypothetical protein
MSPERIDASPSRAQPKDSANPQSFESCSPTFLAVNIDKCSPRCYIALMLLSNNKGSTLIQHHKDEDYKSCRSHGIFTHTMIPPI